jgi:hypothetical protein
MTTAPYRGETKGKIRIGNEPTTIRGIVIPVDWDKEGNALAVAISGSDDEEYVIERNEQGKELLGLIRQEIEVSGVVRKAIKGRKTIVVKSYRLKTGGQ